MENTITEKTYPIENKWLLKPLISMLPGFLIGGVFIAFYLISSSATYSRTGDISFVYFVLIIFGVTAVFVPGLTVFANWLSRSQFHFSLEKDVITIKQGVITKQERHIPYGVIQNLFVSQSLFDRILGVAAFSLENASMGGTFPQYNSSGYRYNSRENRGWEPIGSTGNRVNIPGLKKENAELLKQALLQKMKDNPARNSLSGL